MNLPPQDQLFKLYILADSALPTGGFISSSGLEAISTLGLLNNINWEEYLRSATHSYARSFLPFVREAYLNASNVQTLLELDNTVDVSFSNALGRQSSRSQGRAFLTLFLKSFDSNILNLKTYWQEVVKPSTTFGHLPISFALVCEAINISLEQAMYLFLFLFLRSSLSAAVRLNLIGPYKAQKELFQAEEIILRVLEETRDVDVEDAGITAPLYDLAQCIHTNLCTKLFYN